MGIVYTSLSLYDFCNKQENVVDLTLRFNFEIYIWARFDELNVVTFIAKLYLMFFRDAFGKSV